MEKDYSEGLAGKLLEFMLKFGQWSSFNYNNQFNKNGKSNICLTQRQYSILFLMQKLGISTVSEFESITCISKSSLSLTLSKLVEEGYITKKSPSSEDDGRKVYFCIAEKGVEAYEDSCKRVEEMFENLYKSLTDSQKLDLKEGIEKLNNVF